MRETAEITRTAQMREGFLVARVRRERGHFSVGGDLYTTRLAFELGSESAVIACGCMHEEVISAFPDLRPAVDLHLCDVATGEPMHAVADSWYHLSGESAAREAEARARGRRNYWNAPDPDSVEWSIYWLERAMHTLLASPADMADGRVLQAIEEGDREAFAAWVNDVMRPQWQARADALNAWIDANRGGPSVPAEEADEEAFEIDLGGLTIEARETGEGYREGVGAYYEYAVAVSDGQTTYRTTFGGSVADHSEGRHAARDAAFGVLRELADFSRHDSAEDFAEEMGMSEDLSSADWERWREAHAAAEAMADALEAHADLVGG